MTIRSRRPGLTLVELMVVLVILVGLATIIIPMLPSMLDRTDAASGATNCGEIAKWVQTYQRQYGKYPDQWDALGDGTKLADYLGAANDIVLDAGLTSDEATALVNSGIANLQTMFTTLTGTEKATFDPYPSPLVEANSFPIATGTKLAMLTNTGARRLNLVDPRTGLNAGKYVLLGLGRRCTICGSTVMGPAVHFSSDPNRQPDTAYERFSVVFQVSSTDPKIAIARAKMVGVVFFKDANVLSTSDEQIGQFFDLMKSGQ